MGGDSPGGEFSRGGIIRGGTHREGIRSGGIDRGGIDWGGNSPESIKNIREVVHNVSYFSLNLFLFKALPEGCQDQLCMACLKGFFKLITKLGASTCIKTCPPNYTSLGTICVGKHHFR